MTLDQVTTDLKALSLRVNAIDGQGLAKPEQAVLTQMQKQINGLRSDLVGAVTTLEGILADYIARVNALSDLVNANMSGH